MTAAGHASRTSAQVFLQIRERLREHLRSVDALVEEGAACAWCSDDARAYIPLLLKDPATREDVMVDAPACAECLAKHQPRVHLRLETDAAMRLIACHEVEVEAYDRPIYVARDAASGA